jgi:hypothetical protein
MSSFSAGKQTPPLSGAPNPFASLPRQLSKEHRPDSKEAPMAPLPLSSGAVAAASAQSGPFSALSTGRRPGRRQSENKPPLPENEEKMIKESREAKENTVRPAVNPAPVAGVASIRAALPVSVRASSLSSSASSNGSANSGIASVSSKNANIASGDSDGESGSDRENSQNVSPTNDVGSFSGKRDPAGTPRDSLTVRPLSARPTGSRVCATFLHLCSHVHISLCVFSLTLSWRDL